MKKITLIMVICMALVLPAGAINAKEQTGCKALEKIFSAEVEQENGVCKVEIVRRNLEVTHMGKKLSPELMELAFIAAFEKAGEHSAVMGELALLEDEVNPVMKELQKGNIEISALHNHMIGESPRVLYLHFQGFGDMAQLARTIKSAIDTTKK